MECCCCLRNIQDVLADGKTPYERRFKGLIIPFGFLVEHHPFSTEDQSRIHQFGKKALLGKSLGHVESTKKTQCERSDSAPKMVKNGEHHIPGRRWKSKIFWRRSGPENIHLDAGSPCSMSRSSRFSSRIRRVSSAFARLTHFRMLVKHEMISGPCRETSSTPSR